MHPISTISAARSRHITVIAVIAFLAAAPFKPAAALRAELSVKEVLTNVRKAMGTANSAKASEVILTGTGRRYDVDSAYTFRFTSDGRFLDKTAGPLGEVVGYDGKTTWKVDWTGMPTVAEGEESEGERLIALVRTGLWLAPSAPVDVTVAQEQKDPKSVALHLRLRGGDAERNLLVDRSTWLPRSLQGETDAGKDNWQFSDYRTTSGVKLPFVSTHLSGGMMETYTATAVAVQGAADASAYAPVVARPKDIQFDTTAAAKVEARRARTGHLLVHPVVEGKDVGWFILDSGAGAMCIDPKTAETLKLPAVGKVPAAGIGGVVQAAVRQGSEFSLGQLTMRRPIYIEIDTASLSQFFGVPIAGIVGYDLFNRAVVSVQLAGPVVEVHDPATYKLDRGKWQTLAVIDRLPHVSARYEGNREGLFRLDTGSNGSVDFHAKTVVSNKLLEGRKTTTAGRGGVGGSAAVEEGTLQWFELAGHRFEKPLVAFSKAEEGIFAHNRAAGNIGQKFLEPFNIVFNYSDRKIAFIEAATEK